MKKLWGIFLILLFCSIVLLSGCTEIVDDSDENKTTATITFINSSEYKIQFCFNIQESSHTGFTAEEKFYIESKKQKEMPYYPKEFSFLVYRIGSEDYFYNITYITITETDNVYITILDDADNCTTCTISDNCTIKATHKIKIF